jgi:hypothetical protein
MKYDGLSFRRNRCIGWRVARDEDHYANGEQISGFHVVVFRKNEDGDQPIPLHAHTASNVVISKPKVSVGKSCDGLRYTVGENSGQEISGGDVYTEQVHYLVKVNAVYQFTARRVAKHGDL